MEKCLRLFECTHAEIIVENREIRLMKPAETNNCYFDYLIRIKEIKPDTNCLHIFGTQYRPETGDAEVLIDVNPAMIKCEGNLVLVQY